MGLIGPFGQETPNLAQKTVIVINGKSTISNEMEEVILQHFFATSIHLASRHCQMTCLTISASMWHKSNKTSCITSWGSWSKSRGWNWHVFLDDVLGTSAIATNDVTFLRVIRLIQNLRTCT